MKTKRKATLPVVAQLRIGDHGEAVEILQKYLQRFGYLRTEMPDNDEYAELRAASGAPVGRYGTFDGSTVAALESYQRFSGLPVTGQPDETTVADMSLPRCGCPDIRRDLGAASFVLLGGRWTHTNLTYGIQKTGSRLSAAQVRNGLTAAFAQWARVTNLTFTELPLAAAPNIVIRFADGAHGDAEPFDGVGNVVAGRKGRPDGERRTGRFLRRAC